MTSRIEIQRVYADPGRAGNHRILVDRLWPRGIKKEALDIDEWAKDLAPTTELRRWYGHDPERFAVFARRYRHELANDPGGPTVTRLCEIALKGPLTLLTATRDVERSGAAVLLRRRHCRSCPVIASTRSGQLIGMQVPSPRHTRT
jgi:uncharacterized protein YeaO (DUF488 family)